MADFMNNEEIIPSKCYLNTGNTTPPPFLSESELITLMDKHGIGTDATIAEHIKTIQERYFLLILENMLFKFTIHSNLHLWEHH